MTYTKEEIKTIVMLLNGLTISGIENAKRITLINQILENPEVKENEDGD